MYASLSAEKSRLSKVAEELLADHVGMMAPILVEEVFSQVDAAKPQNEQQLLTAFLLQLRKVLPPELDSDQLIKSLYARYLQS